MCSSESIGYMLIHKSECAMVHGQPKNDFLCTDLFSTKSSVTQRPAVSMWNKQQYFNFISFFDIVSWSFASFVFHFDRRWDGKCLNCVLFFVFVINGVCFNAVKIKSNIQNMNRSLLN